ncbi:putative hydroxymethylpyrimidine transporter CytX [Chelatococcus sambhunathii]|uniref:Hydroxymethylpyrimidine transporter CytX n=1 Tax=Chelatococcus sambhunathii TaxID=363953 RepID=A0ABU1DJS0_9HYPH|nr:putative hydroxymethylpyrimidine transporter CytX [Chelatococcus sambhunathii]MDR4308260.1 putative hydroxymethylpyrimidine transporter CytX [Chelatococcus sambhunathii]
MAPEQTNYDPLTAVPAERRALTGRDTFALWFSLGIGLLVLQAGSFLVPALSLGQALVAIACGSAIGALLLAATGVMGTDAGLATMAATRPALGVRGSAIPTVLNVVQLVGWGAFEILVMGEAASQLAKNAFGFEAPLLWTALFGALATALAVVGPLSFVRRFLRDWGLWLVLAASAWLTYALLASHNLGELFARPGAGGMGFGAAVDLAATMPLSWLPLIADYSRFGRSAGATFRGSALGYFVANVWFLGLGAAWALASGGEASIAVTLATAGAGLALLLVLLDETDNAFADIHSAAISTGTLARVPTRSLALGFGALCTMLALVTPLGQYQDFLLLIGSVFAPLFGIVLADHFVIRRRRVVAQEIDVKGGAYWFTAGWRLSGVAAWLVGVGVYHAMSRGLPEIGATLPSFVAAAAVFMLLNARRGAKAE